MNIILASASPRRKELLQREGFCLTIVPANIDETRRAGEKPRELVERLAVDKARAALRVRGSLAADEVLLAADTIVWTGEDVLGKPADEGDAIRMLRELSGRTHWVSTGVCLIVGAQGGSDPHGERSFVDTTAVTFRALSEDEIREYVASGEPMDKAGAYGIQGGAGKFVSSLEGDYHNVVGLPVKRVVSELEHLGAQRG